MRRRSDLPSQLASLHPTRLRDLGPPEQFQQKRPHHPRDEPG